MNCASCDVEIKPHYELRCMYLLRVPKKPYCFRALCITCATAVTMPDGGVLCLCKAHAIVVRRKQECVQQLQSPSV